MAYLIAVKEFPRDELRYGLIEALVNVFGPLQQLPEYLALSVSPGSSHVYLTQEHREPGTLADKLDSEAGDRLRQHGVQFSVHEIVPKTIVSGRPSVAEVPADADLEDRFDRSRDDYAATD